MGVFHAQRWWAEKFVPSVESLSSFGFEEKNLGCPGNFAGMSRTPGGVQKVCAKKTFVRIFRSLSLGGAGEKETIHRPAPVQNFSLQKKNGVHRGKISVVDMALLVFIGFLYPPPAWKVFL